MKEVQKHYWDGFHLLHFSFYKEVIMQKTLATITAALVTAGLTTFGNTELINDTGLTIYVGTSHTTSGNSDHCHMTQPILSGDNILFYNVDNMLICISSQLEDRDDIAVTQPDTNKISIYLSDNGDSPNWYANSQALTPANTTNIDPSSIIQITK